jgi:3-methyl-2-oxobutanoate hydroxymethyltransferase
MKTFVIGDMPFLSYQVGVPDTVRNAGRFFKETEVDAIKLEGGQRVIEQITAIADADMLFLGHNGLTPQSSGQFGGFKTRGRTAETALEHITDAEAIESDGTFARWWRQFRPRSTRSCAIG